LLIHSNLFENYDQFREGALSISINFVVVYVYFWRQAIIWWVNLG